MGLDVQFNVISGEKFFDAAEESGFDLMENNLSRTFCNLLCRDGLINHKTELAQIGQITKIDIQPIVEMTWYCDEIDMKSQFGLYDTEEEKQEFINQVHATNKKVEGNIEKVKETVEKLIDKLSKIEDLPDKLIKTNFDTLNNQWYFSNFQEDLGDGYIGNNFGHDIRNLKKLLDFAQSIGEKTVFFGFG